MIKFFRKIRHKLFTENKFSKYLLYAVGEIILVVIGILIALQINNLNTQKILGEKEVVYLNNLAGDLARQTSDIQYKVQYENILMEKCRNALIILASTPYDIDGLNKSIINVSRSTFLVANTVFEDLKSSGNLSVIKKDSLRNEIIFYYQKADFIAKIIESNNDKFIDPFSQFLFTNALVDMGHSPSIKLSSEADFSLNMKPFKGANELIASQLNDDIIRFKFHNRIASRGRLSNLHIYFLNDLKTDTEQLAAKIEKYIKTKG